MDIKEIQSLIKFVSKSEVSEVNLKVKDFEIKIKTNNAANPQITYTPPAPVAVQAAPTVPVVTPVEQPATPLAETAKSTETSTDETNYVTIKSPMIGTFYRKPGPDKPIFVEVGTKVEVGSVVCIVEAMKLFNEIESEVAGTIVKVLVDDSSPVEYDQPLFLVDPS